MKQPSSSTTSRWRRRLIALLSTILLLTALVIGLAFVAIQSERGTQVLWRMTTWALQGRLSGKVENGALANGLHLRHLTYRDSTTRITMDRLDAAWQLHRSPLGLTVDYLRLGTVDAHLSPSPSATTPPQQLVLPLPITLHEGSLQQLILHREQAITIVRDLRIKGISDQVQHTLIIEKISTPYGAAAGTLHLNGKHPFALNGAIELRGAHRQERYRIGTRLSGTLETLSIALQASGDQLNGHAQIDAAPFASMPLQRIQLAIDHINPALFSANAPQADLNLLASLTPTTDKPFTIGGSVKLTNAQPGTFDQDRLPLLSATAEMQIDAELQQLSHVKMTLAQNALIEGSGEFGSNRHAKLSLHATKLDPHALHRKSVAGRINADLDIEGTLAAEPLINLQFAVHDSIYNHLSFIGSGNIHVAGKRLLPSDAQLSIAGNQLFLKGGFGSPSDQLKVKVHAPSLDRLGFGLAGSLQLDGQFTGAVAQPNLHATYLAQQLVFGAHRLTRLSGKVDVQGFNTFSNTQVAMSIDAQGYDGPDTYLNTVTAQLNGTYGHHTLSTKAQGQLRNKPLNLTLFAQGRLNEINDSHAWSGIVRTLENRGMPHIALQTPMSLSVAANRLTLGATQLTLEQALIDLKHFSYDNGHIRSEGSAGALDIGHVLALQREFTGSTPPLRTDLIVDGRWNVEWTNRAKGFIEFERRRGDIIVNSGYGDKPLGLSELRMHADLLSNHIVVHADANATRIGSLTAQGQITLPLQNGTLTLSPDTPLTGRVIATVPQLKNISALLGPEVALDGSVNMDMAVTGTIDHPKWSGTLAGDRLSLTLYDPGIRLRDGVVRIGLTENVIDLHQIEFHGGQGTLRANGHIQLDQSNPNLSASVIADHLQLFAGPDQQLTLSGQAQIAHINEKLRVNGKFTIDQALFDLPKSSTPQLGDDVVVVQRDGKIPAATNRQHNQITQATQAGEKPVSRFSPYMTIQLDLGENFRFRGANADLLLRGRMDMHSEPYLPLQTTGTVRVVDGAYEVFGRRLTIERGIINFQGSIKNPNINILAMRRNQEIEAGVQVNGTANQPRISLVSEPTVADEEKLSWLMFGHGSANTALGQQQAASAALALLNSKGGKRIAQGFGLDEFSIGSSESGLADQQVVNLGKAISEQLHLGYEQSLTGAASVAKVTWQLSRRWSMVARGGAINSLDVLFNSRFD